MIRIERVALPAGLRAIAHRDPRGDLVIYVSDVLDAKRQRAAVMEALRASRRTGWRTWLPPVGLVLLTPFRRWARHAAAALRAHPAGWAAATTVVVAGTAASGSSSVPRRTGTTRRRRDRPRPASTCRSSRDSSSTLPPGRAGQPQPSGARYRPDLPAHQQGHRSQAPRHPRLASRHQRRPRRRPRPACPDRRPCRHRRRLRPRRRHRLRHRHRHRREAIRSRASSS